MNSLTPRADIVWGVEASPFLLKLEAMLRYCGRPFRRLPGEGRWLGNVLTARRLEAAKRCGGVSRYPNMDQSLDEYPSVPFFSEDGRQFQYDSTAIGYWLDEAATPEQSYMFPVELDVRFAAQLIDEAFDEFGLYMVHHNRWVRSATDTTMGERTAQEMSRLITPLLARGIRVNLPRRQVRRCPYLFSVAPQGYTADVEPQRVPPARAGFPPTHDLLDESWRAYLAAMETILAAQPFILGERFTIADASAYGQLSMNLIDPSTNAELHDRAPLTHQWLLDIRDGKHRASRGKLFASEALDPLLRIIMTTFAPLMDQNEKAWRIETQKGQKLFNERAFNRGQALYDGELNGHAFRSVVKTFQVRVWNDLRENWRALPDAERVVLAKRLPGSELFSQD